jgi:hypothetical protein
VLPVVEADTGVIVVDAKIIASVKIVAAAVVVVVARYVLCSRGIFLLLLLSLFSVFIFRTCWDAKQKIKEFHQLTRKEHSNTFWLLVKGVNIEQWEKRAPESAA